MRIVEYDHIINKKKVEEHDSLEDIVNKCSKVESLFLCDPFID